MPLSIEERAGKVDALVFDVDGVLTRGEIVYGPGGEWKAFHTRDGHGLKMARAAGLKIGWLTARRPEAVRRRAKELGIDALKTGREDKGAAIREMLGHLQVDPLRCCYVGDDLLDLAAMRQVGFPVAVADAAPEVQQYAAWTTSRAGGEGAAREVVEFVLRARGVWDEMVQRYTEGEYA